MSQAIGLPSAVAHPLTRGSTGPEYRDLLCRLLAGTQANLAVLGLEGKPVLEESMPSRVGARVPGSEPLPTTPSRALLITDPSRGGAWSRWCRERLVTAAAVAPVTDGTGPVGTMVLACTNANRLNQVDLSTVVLAAWMAGQVYEADRHAVNLLRELSNFEPAIQMGMVGAAGRGGPAGFRDIARALGSSLDATYCRLASRDAQGGIRIHAAGGRRPGSDFTRRRLTMARLPRCTEATRSHRPAVLHFENASKADLMERDLLFSPSTKTGVILPFAGEEGLEGVLLIGEERERSRNRLDDRLTALDMVAQRLGTLVSVARTLEDRHLKRLKRQTRVIELRQRRRLARKLHDDVGQALTVLLLQLRFAIKDNRSSPDDLRRFESAAQSALIAARALAYDMRQQSEYEDPIEAARTYIEMMLASARIELSWMDTRTQRGLPTQTTQEVVRVIKEAVLNVVRHSGATRAEIHLRSVNRGLIATIRDDGVGLPGGALELGKRQFGLGLTASAEGIERVGGTIQVSRPYGGGGTLVRVAVGTK